MDDDAELAPAVQAILETARQRTADTREVAVTARPFAAALGVADADGKTPVIAEIKPTSPTTEGRSDDDPVKIAEAMVEGGAAALSVLTEPEHFGGSTDALARVREAVEVPILRKDFILREEQLDAVAADAVLIIVRFVDDLAGLIQAARKRGMEPLVEVHTPGELEAALAAGASLVGINNRDLARLEVDLSTFERVAPEVPDTVTLIAESGIRTPADATRMRAAGADGLLIGSAIMDGDVVANTRRFVEAE
ncbi:MAG: indole-3-glycerol phosphate synthase [Halobacteriaceae archaeon]